MSGIEDPGTPPELPQEYADVYREAYLRALAEDAATHPVPVPAAVEIAVPVDEDDSDPGSGRVWLIVAIVALLLIVAAYVAGDLLSDEAPAGSGSTEQVSQSPVARHTREAGLPEESTAVAIESAEATCGAPAGVDSANQPVSYAVENTFDDDSSTAWRCYGKARGETITFTLSEETEIAAVGLIPGYAKTDASSGTDRYAENNRITRVRWTLADGVVVDQDLDPNPADRSIQTIGVPTTSTRSITLEILRVQKGVRNTTAISSVLIAAAS